MEGVYGLDMPLIMTTTGILIFLDKQPYETIICAKGFYITFAYCIMSILAWRGECEGG